MAPHINLVRDESSEGSGGLSKSSTTYVIGGSVVAGVLVLGAALYIGIRYIRQRSRSGREEERGAAFLNVRGVMKETEGGESAEALALRGKQFTRNNLTGSVIMPATKEEILQYHQASGNIPKPFRPFSFALNGPPSPTGSSHSNNRASSASFLSAARNSFLSVASGHAGNRMSTASTVSTFGPNQSQRKVRQLFDPVLPDELVISLGQALTVVQSYDDGWCVVGRSSVLKPEEVELGAVPAWVFVKPVKGLKAERPMRSSSLGVSVDMSAGPGFSSREECISWSNFN